MGEKDQSQSKEAVHAEANTPLKDSKLRSKTHNCRKIAKSRRQRNKEHRYSTSFRENITEIVRHLQEGRLDFQTISKQGLFPLHEAVVCGYLDCAKSLIELGAELTQETPDGLTPLEVAVMAGNFDAAALLIQHGAPVDRIRDGMPRCCSPVEKKGFSLRSSVNRKSRTCQNTEKTSESMA